MKKWSKDRGTTPSPVRSLYNSSKVLLKFSLIGYLLVLVLLVLFETMLVYPRPPKQSGDWSPAWLAHEDVYFTAADGTKLHGWYVEHPHPRAQVVLCHGNGEHVSYLASELAAMRDDYRISIFAFDYRGYGQSDGQPHEAGILSDGEAAQLWLAERAGIKQDQIVLMGRSLGGAVVVHLASVNGARGLILDRTFHSMVEMAAELYWWAPVRLLMQNRYPSIDWIRRYQGPLLQAHGTADDIVPLRCAKALFDACPSDDKQFVTMAGVGHNDPAPAAFVSEVDRFFGRLSRTD
jgi:hypothetical protein